MYEVIRASPGPRSPISLYKRTANERRHYEKVDMPDGVVVLGDAACCFNPIYGQARTERAAAYAESAAGRHCHAPGHTRSL